MWVSEGGMKKPYCFKGLILTMNALEGLWEYLSSTSSQQKYLLTAHLNQDPLENSISTLRSNRGSYEQNPSALRLNRNLKQICFQDVTVAEMSGYNDAHSKNLFPDDFKKYANIVLDAEVHEIESGELLFFKMIQTLKI